MSLSQKAILCSLSCLLMGGLSGWFTAAEIGSWYASLLKPIWNPPNYLFGPVWSVLYVLMGIAFALVWHRGKAGKGAALRIFAFQFVLNLAWTPVFFCMHRPDAALWVIGSLLIVLAITIHLFRKQTPLAGWLLVPYILWVGFATALNAAIFVLNPIS